eukprot:5149944-Ditylum_brightwellii.AAC.1
MPLDYCKCIVLKMANCGFCTDVIPQTPNGISLCNRDQAKVNPMPWISSHAAENSNPSDSELCKSAGAALVVLGGFQEAVYPGGRVSAKLHSSFDILKNAYQKGVVLSYQFGQAKLQIALSTTADSASLMVGEEGAGLEVPISSCWPESTIPVTEFKVRAVQALHTLLSSRKWARSMSAAYPDITERLTCRPSKSSESALSSCVEKQQGSNSNDINALFSQLAVSSQFCWLSPNTVCEAAVEPPMLMLANKAIPETQIAE